MCMQPTQVRPYQKWHWAGDEIVYDTIIPAARAVAGTRAKRYPIDVREYLTTQDNAVIRSKVRELVSSLSPADQVLFSSQRPGSFDFRADKVTEYVSQLHYKPVGRHFDQWLFPDETLFMGGGDCEDMAFVLAAMLQASGISSYCIRVALGRISHVSPKGRKTSDHAWVVYMNERGVWEILEPLAITGKKNAPVKGEPLPHPLGELEYTPFFVFNRDHLWRVRGPLSTANRPLVGYLDDREFWPDFKPQFAVKVHEGIYDEALTGIAPGDLASIKRASFVVDANVLEYDPRDHFDFAYISEGWQRVQSRLTSGSLQDFGLAIHAIADFYAHSAYTDFAAKDASGNLVPYDPTNPALQVSPNYDFGPYAPLPGCSLDPREAAAEWNGKLISGQWWRWYSTFPDDLQNSADFARHRCLPDHDLFAVDGPNPGSQQKHYAAADWLHQFQLRRNAAVTHIRQAYGSWRQRGN